MNSIEQSNDARGNMYAGSNKCVQCHRSISNLYQQTTHFNSTQTTSPDHVLGSFDESRRAFVVDERTRIEMHRNDSGLFQVLVVNDKEVECHRMDITFGGKHAQTFLYWQNERVYELPISFYKGVSSWGSSPGYPSVVNFKRLIAKGCFECHSSYITGKTVPGSSGVEETFERSSLINGIDCERCHGPAANHVNYHLAYPENKGVKYMVDPKKLSRQQQLDACAVCHSGNDIEKEITTFKFKMGDTLANFYSPYARRADASREFDVHGNQYNLLAESQCFLKSKTLTCITCHDPHSNASTDLSEYSKKCLSCHAGVEHNIEKLNLAKSESITSNCIDCHMPEKSSRAIYFQLSGSALQSAYMLRTHKIAVYANGSATTTKPKTMSRF